MCKPPSVNLHLNGQVVLTFNLASLTCTSQGSPFHRSLRERQRVNSSFSRKTSRSSSSSKDVSFLIWLPSCYRSRLTTSGRLLWVDFPQCKHRKSSHSLQPHCISSRLVYKCYLFSILKYMCFLKNYFLKR